MALATSGLGSRPLPDRLLGLTTLGLTAANAPCALLRWSPETSPDTDWARVDRWLEAVQTAGLEDIELCLDFGTDTIRGGHLSPRSGVPRGIDRARVAAWAASVVERYDDDGEVDAPDLQAPVRRYRLGSDLEPGGVEPSREFPALWDAVREAIASASPDAELWLPPLRARGTPGPAALERLAPWVSAPQRFDGWSIEATGTAAELDAWLAWVEEVTPGKPVEVLGALGSPRLEAGTPARCEVSEADRGRLDPGLREAERCAVAEALSALLGGEPGALAWARTEVAGGLARKAIVSASRGVSRLELGQVTDSTLWREPALAAGAGLAAWSGLFEPDGSLLEAGRTVGRLAPSIRTRGSVVRLPVGGSDVRLYAIGGDAEQAWVAWVEPDGFRGPGVPSPVRSLEIEVSAPRVRVEPLVAPPGGVADREIEVPEGRLALELSASPLRIVPLD